MTSRCCQRDNKKRIPYQSGVSDAINAKVWLRAQAVRAAYLDGRTEFDRRNIAYVMHFASSIIDRTIIYVSLSYNYTRVSRSEKITWRAYVLAKRRITSAEECVAEARNCNPRCARSLARISPRPSYQRPFRVEVHNER